MGLPSFFKIMIGDFKNVLRIPRFFVKKYEDVFPDNALLETKYEESWSIQIEQIGEDYCFTHGWPQFVAYHHLQMYDFLVFSPKTEGKSIFSVSMFDPSACEKEITFGDTSNSPSNGHPENIVIDLENTSSPTSNAVQGADRNSSKSSSMMKCESSGNGAEFSDDFARERTRRFVVCLKKHNKYRMVIPMKFARENGILGKKNLRLVNSKGETWPVTLVLRSFKKNTVIELVKGWSEFWKKNRLVVGRRCSLEFIPDADCFRVQLLGRAKPLANCLCWT